MLRWILTGDERCTGWRTRRVGAVGTGEVGAHLAKAIEIGRLDLGVIDAEGKPVLLVGRD
jgi:phosphoglycerate dehydrogenase-like enzyme